MRITFGKERAVAPDRTVFLLTAVGKELESLRPYLEIMRRQIAGAMEVTDSSVMGVIQRINTVHELTGNQVERIQDSMETSRDLVHVAEEHSGHLHELVELVRTVIQSHLLELDGNIQRTQAFAEEIADLSEIAEVVAEIATQSELLSVNALIQAAQARGVGAAFSVVANEILKMATKAGKAAEGIRDRIGSLTEKMATEIEKLKALSEKGQGTSVSLNRIIEDLQAFESRFNASSQSLSGTIDGLHANNTQVVTNLTQALGLIQFQDVVFQRIDHVDKALLELTQHSQAMVANLADPAWEGALKPTLKDRMDQHQLFYVMSSQRDVHDSVLNGTTSRSHDGPAIELF